MFDCKNLKMNFVVYSAIVLYFTIFQANCRSVHLDTDALPGSEVKEDKDLLHDGISGRFSWKKLKPILRREIQRIRNVKGKDANKMNQKSTENTDLIPLKKNETFPGESLNADKTKDISSTDGTRMTSTSFILPEPTNNSSQNEETIDESDVEEEFASNVTHDQVPQLYEHSTTSNFQNTVFSHILNETELVNTTFVKSELTTSSQNEETMNKINVEEDFSSNIAHDQIPQLDQHSTTSNFPNTVVSDILNKTELVNTFEKSELTHNSSQNEEIIDEIDMEEDFVSNNMTQNQMPELYQHSTMSNFPATVISDILNQTEMVDATFLESELTYSSQNEETIDETDVEENFASNMTYDEMPHLDYSLTTNNLPDNIISDILNQTADSLLFQALNDNGSSIDNFEFDETSVLSQGGHIATLQEVSTIGFELLIDSETRKNLLLMELISSQPSLIDDDFTDEEDSDFTNHINESEEDEITSNEEVSFTDVTGLNTGGFDFTTSHFHERENTTDKEVSLPLLTSLNTDAGNSDFTILKLKINETEKEETTSNEETDFSINEIETEITEFITDENEIEENEFELSVSDQNNNGTELANTEPEDPMCPDPGWCVFWFLALDTCAKNSHCHGSLICCTIGCSKTCIDVDR